MDILKTMFLMAFMAKIGFSAPFWKVTSSTATNQATAELSGDFKIYNSTKSANTTFSVIQGSVTQTGTLTIGNSFITTSSVTTPSLSVGQIVLQDGTILTSTSTLGGGGVGISTITFPTISIAAFDSNYKDKSMADYVCSGSSDQIKFQQAINQLVELGGGRLFVFGGQYNLMGQGSYPRSFCVSFPSSTKNLTIEGVSRDSAILNFVNPVVPSYPLAFWSVFFSSYNITSVSFKNLTFNNATLGTDSEYGARAISPDGNNTGGQSKYWTIDNCKAINIALLNLGDNTIHNNLSATNNICISTNLAGSSPLLSIGGRNSAFSNNIIESGRFSNVPLYFAGPSQGISVINNVINDCVQSVFIITKVSSATISGNTVFVTTTTPNNRGGFALGECSNILISGNSITAPHHTTTTVSGIWVENSSDISIVGNKIYGTDVGINIRGGGNRIYVLNNAISETRIGVVGAGDRMYFGGNFVSTWNQFKTLDAATSLTGTNIIEKSNSWNP